MTGAVERFKPTGVQLVDEAVLYWGQAGLLPDVYKNEDGSTNWPDLIIAGASLYALDVNPIRNLPDTYVVKGRLGMMAGLQTALAQREGVDIDVQGDHISATARITRPGEQRADGHLVTVTMTQAQKAGWTRNPCYQSMPDKMLAARAVTTAINRYAPGVLRGIASTVRHVARLDIDTPISEATTPAAAGTGKSPAAAGYLALPGPVRLREVVIDQLDYFKEVDPARWNALRDQWKTLGGPHVLEADLAALLVLRHLIDEAEAASYDQTPDAVHDDAPETGGDIDDAEYEDDPERPY